jgi:hypothetical protein
MKRIFFSIIMMLLIGASLGIDIWKVGACDGKSQQPIGREAIRDITFSRGFGLSPLVPSIVIEGGGFNKTNVDTLRFGIVDNPVWQMNQWHSRYCLGGAQPGTSDDGSITYSNVGKKVTRYRDGTLLLELTSSV